MNEELPIFDLFLSVNGKDIPMQRDIVNLDDEIDIRRDGRESTREWHERAKADTHTI